MKERLGLQSMTGFGTAEAAIGSGRYRVELKSLNHRYLEVKVRLPRELSSAEIALRQALQKRFQRGAFEVKVERVYEGAAGETSAGDAAAHGLSQRVSLNLPLARAVHGALAEMRDALRIDAPILPSDIAQYPDVFSRAQAEFSAEEAWSKLEPLFALAVDSLARMRKREGSALTEILRETVRDLMATIEGLRTKRGEAVNQYPDRIRARIATLLENFPVEFRSASADPALKAVLESRLAQELALLADRTDIEEELVRFRGHLEHLSSVISDGGPAGRKIDFILQELNREINTLGNKAQDLGMSTEVVGAKLKIEQLREQVLNIE